MKGLKSGRGARRTPYKTKVKRNAFNIACCTLNLINTKEMSATVNSERVNINQLFEPFTLNASLQLKNRILMAPMTRCMAGEGLVPTEASAAYYARRAESGLIVTEATIIRPDGQGYIDTPGIYSEAQIKGWQHVTDSVHAAGGKIMSQLWHCGRVAHSHFSGSAVLAPSACKLEGTVPRLRELEYEMPVPATTDDIAQLVKDYRQAAENAMQAGFDGVEIHAANGYLLDQFLHYDTNKREDDFGGNAAAMARFPLQVIDSIIESIGSERVGLRLSPAAYFNMAPDPRDREVFDYLLAELDKRSLAYLHAGVFDDSLEYDLLGGRVTDYMRSKSKHTLVGVGSYTPETAAEAIAAERFDLVAIGRLFIANPDFIRQVQAGEPLQSYSETMLETLD